MLIQLLMLPYTEGHVCKVKYIYKSLQDQGPYIFHSWLSNTKTRNLISCFMVSLLNPWHVKEDNAV